MTKQHHAANGSTTSAASDASLQPTTQTSIADSKINILDEKHTEAADAPTTPKAPTAVVPKGSVAINYGTVTNEASQTDNDEKSTRTIPLINYRHSDYDDNYYRGRWNFREWSKKEACYGYTNRECCTFGTVMAVAAITTGLILVCVYTCPTPETFTVVYQVITNPAGQQYVTTGIYNPTEDTQTIKSSANDNGYISLISHEPLSMLTGPIIDHAAQTIVSTDPEGYKLQVNIDPNNPISIPGGQCIQMRGLVSPDTATFTLMKGLVSPNTTPFTFSNAGIYNSGSGSASVTLIPNGSNSTIDTACFSNSTAWQLKPADAPKPDAPVMTRGADNNTNSANNRSTATDSVSTLLSRKNLQSAPSMLETVWSALKGLAGYNQEAQPKAKLKLT